MQKKRGRSDQPLKVTSYDGSDLDNFYVNSVQTFLSVLNVESYFVVLADLVDKTGYVNKDVLTAI